MKKLIAAFIGVVLGFSSYARADEVIKASEMKDPPMAPPSKEAQKKAHQRVEKRKTVLKEKLEAGASAQEVGTAKAQLQVDRVEANRQDYLNDPEAKKKVEETKK